MQQQLWVNHVIFYTHDFVNFLFLWSSDVRHLNPVTTYSPGGNRNWVDSLWSLSATRVCRYVDWWLDNRIPCRIWTNTRPSIQTPCWTNCTLIPSIPTWWVTTIWRWLVTIRPKAHRNTILMLRCIMTQYTLPSHQESKWIFYVMFTVTAVKNLTWKSPQMQDSTSSFVEMTYSWSTTDVAFLTQRHPPSPHSV